MNILITTDVFPPNCGGSGWSTYYLAQALIERGHNVTVIKPVNKNRKISNLQSSIFNLPLIEFPYTDSRIPLLHTIYHNEYFYLNFSKFLKNFLRQNKFDIIHGQHQMTIPPSISAGLKVGIPVVSTIRDYWFRCYFSTSVRSDDEICEKCSINNLFFCVAKRQPLFTPFLPYIRYNVSNKYKMLAKSSKIIAVSSFIKNKLIDFVPVDKIEVIPNIVVTDNSKEESVKKSVISNQLSVISRDTDYRLPLTDYCPFILFVGKLSNHKGIGILLSAMKFAKPKIKLLIVGDGEMRNEIKKTATENNLSIDILDWLPNDEVLELMRRTELLLFPSSWNEPLSRVLLEALSVGAPILAMNTGGTGDIITDGYNGVLVSNAKEFANRINPLLDDKEFRNKLSENAIKSAKEKFSKEVIVKKIEEVYQSVYTLHKNKGGQ